MRHAACMRECMNCAHAMSSSALDMGTPRSAAQAITRSCPPHLGHLSRCWIARRSWWTSWRGESGPALYRSPSLRVACGILSRWAAGRQFHLHPHKLGRNAQQGSESASAAPQCRPGCTAARPIALLDGCQRARVRRVRRRDALIGCAVLSLPL